MDRSKLTFKYYFNAGLDKVTGRCDEEGSDVYEIDDNGNEHYIGSLPYILPLDIAEMEDDELEERFIENGILTNY